MNRQQRRYETREQILAEVDAYRARAAACVADAEQCEKQAQKLWSIPEFIEDGNLKAERAKQLRRRAYLIYDKKLPFLKDKLSEFMTPSFPQFHFDQSIQANQ